MTNKEQELSAARLKALQEITKGDYKAFLYDCDGTLADNMEAHKESYAQVALAAGVEIDPAIIDEFAGLPIPPVVEEINKRYHSTFDPVEFERTKSELFYNEYVEKILPITFVVEHLRKSVGKYKIGVVSGGSTRMIKKTLQVLRIDHLIDVLVCAGDTEHGKPSPDPFLLAADKLGVNPKKCFVFEDGEAGVKAAQAAGMKWVRIDKILE